MPTITFIETDGTEHSVTVDAGTTARDAAIQNDVPGIDGDCGGNGACGTCHVYVPEAWSDKVGVFEEGSIEAELLQFADGFRPNSRLSCQIPVTVELDGLVLDLPEGQF